jgi:methyl-accepting chemotaxis protein
MTQEELDALMNGDVDLDSLEEDTPAVEENNSDIQEEIEGSSSSRQKIDLRNADDIYPPAATDDHKVVSQLDEVTKESELKAGEVLDVMDEISNSIMENEDRLNSILETLNKHKELLENLSNNFPHIQTFKNSIEEIDESINSLNEIIESGQNSGDSIMMAMDIMQYQDIHRQKIERVINIMRSLIGYMNRLFEGKVEDESRVSSATHIHGDTSTEDVVADDDIEALLAQFGK